MMFFGWLLAALGLGAVAYRMGYRPEDRGLDGGFPRSDRSALDILKERYARGEISQEEFYRMREDLES